MLWGWVRWDKAQEKVAVVKRRSEAVAVVVVNKGMKYL
jgi:hypothetical protein